MNPLRFPILVVTAVLLLLSCTPAARDQSSRGAPGDGVPSDAGGQQPAARPQTSTMILVTRIEPKSIFTKSLNTGIIADGTSARRLFNAAPFIVDETEIVHPYLVEEAPKLDTDTWKVFPDGRMETTYQLRPNLVWHDNTPLTAEDFVFSWRVFVDPALGLFSQIPQHLMDEVVAVSPRTILIKWKRPSPDAEALVLNRFPPLPQHILEAPYLQGPADAFGALPYWTREFVGAGPFKVDRWEPGVAIEGSAFDAHALGRPRIDRIRVLFISDPNTVVANLLSGAAHGTLDSVIRFQQGEILKNEWAASKGGEVLLSPIQARYVQVQFRRDVVNPRSIHDRRVRAAILQSIDRKELADALLGGQGIVAQTMVSPQREGYADIDRALTKYPYDPRRAEQLMGEAGFAKDGGGTYAQAGERFSPEMRALAGAAEEQELTVLTDLLRRSGVNVQPLVVAPAQATDGQYVATFPAFSTSQTGTTGDTPLVKLLIGRSPSAQNRWSGTALGGWTHPEYERAYEDYTTTLNRAERIDAVVQMMRLVSEEIPVFTLYYNFQVDAFVSSLAAATTANETWNVHEWRFK